MFQTRCENILEHLHMFQSGNVLPLREFEHFSECMLSTPYSTMTFFSLRVSAIIYITLALCRKLTCNPLVQAIKSNCWRPQLYKVRHKFFKATLSFVHTELKLPRLLALELYIASWRIVCAIFQST